MAKWMLFDKLDEIPEHLREGAVKEGETYKIDGDGLLAKNKELLGTVTQFKDAAKKLKEFDGVDPAKAKAALEEVMNLETRRRELDAEVQKAVREAASVHETKQASIAAERDKFKSGLEKAVVVRGLTEIIAKKDGDPFFLTDKLVPHVRAVEENGEFVPKVFGADGKPRFNSKGDPMSLDELVDEAKTDKRFAPAFKAPAASGSGAGAGAGSGQGQGDGQVVSLTREQAKDNRVYRQALEQVKGDASKIVVKD
jgi:hypothetical protein